MSRPLRLGCFTATQDRVIAVDDRAPIVAEVAVDSGEVLRVRTWPVPPFTGKPVASEVKPPARAGSSTELVELVQGKDADAPLCFTCGTKMRRAGSCYVCEGCGSTSGCS